MIFESNLLAQSSSIILDITDTTEIKFLDTIEAKLLKHINEIVTKKRKIDISMYEINSFRPGEWAFLKTIREILEGESPKEKLTTNKYELDLKWNPTLDTAYIMGFSRLYYYPNSANVVLSIYRTNA